MTLSQLTTKMQSTHWLRLSLLLSLACVQEHSWAALDDPTRPKIDITTESDAAYKLQTIITGSGRYLAVINGKTLGVGSQVNGARVIAIHKNHVVLLRSGQKKNLYLFGRRIWTFR